MKILIIEDDIATRNILQMGLENNSYIVDVAEDGTEGSYLARTNNYDLIILDNVLPKKQGSKVCKDIRGHGSHVPILMLSVKSEVMEKVTLLDGGVDDYMTKPFSFEELLARVKTLLRRPRKIEEKIIKIGKLELNRDTQILKNNGENIYLTRKEYILFEHLLAHRGSVVTRGQILEYVWNMEGDPFSNTIETHILNLRRKIGDKSRKIIQSVPGRGYRVP
jgi:DNA-binding response OmpR family regulator